MNWYKWLCLIFFIPLATGCGTDFASALSGQESISSEDTPPPAPEDYQLSKIAYRWDGKHPDSSQWTNTTAMAVDEFEVLSMSEPTDVHLFCTNYSQLTKVDKRLFWIYLFSAMTQLESSFKPEATYTENFKDNDGNFIVSRGLLQLSIESANGYGCSIANALDLHNADINLQCGMRIFKKWVSKDGLITGKSGSTWLGAARYWAVLRHSDTTIKNWTQTIPFCN